MEKGQEGKKGRRIFLWQVGAGLLGLTGLSRLAKAMTAPRPLFIPRCPDPDIPVVCDQDPFTCDQAQQFYTCYNSFTCEPKFVCGGSFSGDFNCEKEPFSCRIFTCQGADYGVDFTCKPSYSCGGTDFQCERTDFTCPQNFTCTEKFDCTGIQYTCPSTYTCNPKFDCETGWSGDFDCLGNFTCITDFDCKAWAEPGVQFECRQSFTCTGEGQPFYCAPGDFGCTNQYQCTVTIGALSAYVIPIEPQP